MAFSFLYLAFRALLGALAGCRRGLDVKDSSVLDSNRGAHRVPMAARRVHCGAWGNDKSKYGEGRTCASGVYPVYILSMTAEWSHS